MSIKCLYILMLTEASVWPGVMIISDITVVAFLYRRYFRTCGLRWDLDYPFYDSFDYVWQMFWANIARGYSEFLGIQPISILNGMGQWDTLLYIYTRRVFVWASRTPIPFIDWVGMYETTGITFDLGLGLLSLLILSCTVWYLSTCKEHVH